MKVGSNRLGLATRDAMKCLETATCVLQQMPHTTGLGFFAIRAHPFVGRSTAHHQKNFPEKKSRRARKIEKSSCADAAQPPAAQHIQNETCRASESDP